jgi:hypothetical protein
VLRRSKKTAADEKRLRRVRLSMTPMRTSIRTRSSEKLGESFAVPRIAAHR